MDISSLKNLYRQVIMDHYKSPRNKGIPSEDQGYHKVHMRNPSCGDDVTISIKLDGNTLTSIQQDGTGCSICCSSASVMSEVLEGKTTTEAVEIINNFYEIVKGEPYNQELDMGDAVVYVGVSDFPARIKCATISWKAVETAIEEQL